MSWESELTDTLWDMRLEEFKLGGEISKEISECHDWRKAEKLCAELEACHQRGRKITELIERLQNDE